jgi:hypothetical protein
LQCNFLIGRKGDIMKESKTVYQTDENGFFLHPTAIYSSLIPYRAHEEAPPPTEAGKVARRVNDGWDVGEDHRRDVLYIAGTNTPYEIGKAVDAGTYDGYGAIPPWLSTTTPEPPPLTLEELIKREILAIEAQVTDRRVREAVLGLDEGWLAARNAEIAALRAQLQSLLAGEP